MRTAGIMLFSLALTCAVIGNAYYQKKQFYPSVVYITKSNPSMAVIYVQGLLIVFIMNTFLRKIFFGNLRAAELEHLVEKVWYAVTETCLAFTVFRDDFSPKFIALFTLLLFLKSFHWLAEDRVDFMERSPVITWLFHVRVCTLLVILFVVNLTMLHYAYNSTLVKGASVQLVFGFEYAVLLTVVLNIGVKYILHKIDLESENPWDNKPVYLLYTELIIGFLKVLLYMGFVTIMVRIYTLPLFAFRPMYYTMRNFKKALHDIIMSRRAIRNMNTLYPDATPEELAAADNVCIICREEMMSASKKLPCNHIFHTACLRSWFQRQQTCPTCRLNILRPRVPNPRERNNQNAQPGAAPAAPLGGAAAAGVNQNEQAHQIPIWAGFQHPHILMPQVPNQAANSNNNNDTNTTNNNNNNNNNNTTSNIPFATFQHLGSGTVPMFAPPFASPVSTFVPLPPVPTPPPNLTALTEEEVRTMEGNLRQAVEARIQTLQRVQLLLDAANAMMNQYQIAAATANIPTASTSATSQESREPKEPSGSTEPSTEEQTSRSTRSPGASTSKAEATAMPSTSQSAETSDENEALRRRRLQKFSTQAATE